MSAVEKLRELDAKYRERAEAVSTAYAEAWMYATLWHALPQIDAVIAAAEELPEFFQTPDGQTHSFVPLLDALQEALS
jgi:hypothetical protein